MSVITIQRPNPTRNYNKNYNVGEYHDAFPNLKMRDIHLLGYLLSLPAKWNLNKKAIAKQLKMGVWTVGDSFRNLIKAGIASYKRSSDGKVKWVLELSDEIIAKLEGKNSSAESPPPPPPPPTTPVKSAQSEFPTLELPTVLETNDLLKKTTNASAAVVVEDVKILPIVEVKVKAVPMVKVEVKAVPIVKVEELPIPACFTESEVKIAKRKLATLPSHELQLAVLAQTTLAILNKKARTPFKYLLGLINIALKGEFGMPSVPEDAEAIKKAEENERERVIQGIVNRNRESIMAELEVKYYVYFKGLGIFYQRDLEPYLNRVQNS